MDTQRKEIPETPEAANADEAPSSLTIDTSTSPAAPQVDKTLRKMRVLFAVIAVTGIWSLGAYYYDLSGATFEHQHPISFWAVFGLMAVSVSAVLFVFVQAGLPEIARRLEARTDTEHKQALLRQVIVSLVIGIVAFLPAFGAEGPGIIWSIFIMSIGLCMSSAVLLHVLVKPQFSRIRRTFTVGSDPIMMCFIMYVGGEGVAILYPLLLFVVFGNGFRYGVPWLLASGAFSTVGFGTLIVLSDYWQQVPALSWALFALNIILPIYASTLIKALTAAKAEAEAANQAKSRFLATISHELRTPLTAVIGLSGLIKNTHLDADQRGMVRSIGTSAKALLSLINNILDFSKYESGNIAMVSEPFDLYMLMAEIESMFSVQAKARNLDFCVHMSADVPPGLVGDRDHLRDILINLAGNAMKFTEKGHVAVLVNVVESKGAQRIHIAVRDTGIGIAPEQQARIFERFSQADETTNRKYGGTGLGLAIVRHLVAAMDGTLELDSVEGEGSTFHFTLPLNADDAQAPEAEGQASAQAGRQVFVLSADESLRQSAATVLEARGETPVPVESPARFLKMISAGALPRRPLVLFDSREGSMQPGEFARQAQGLSERVRPVMAVARDREVTLTKEAQREMETCFAVEIPLPANDASIARALHFAGVMAGGATTKESDGQEKVTLRPKSVLLAEDNPVNQKVLTRILESAGHDVVAVSSGDEALDALEDGAEEGRFDIAFLDLNMPEMSGTEVAQMYRFANMDRPHLPMIALTADATSEGRAAADGAGMDDYLTKPIEPEALLAAVEKYCKDDEDAEVSAGDETPLPDDPSVAAHPLRGEALPPIIDPMALANLQALGGEDFYDDLVAEFLADAVKIRKRLTIAVERADSQEVRDATHALRSAAAHFGAKRLHGLCMSVSKITEDEVRERGGGFLDELSTNLDLVAKELGGKPLVKDDLPEPAAVQA